MVNNINNFNRSLTIDPEIQGREEKRKLYWALKDQFWKQIIDGSVHKHGPWVFDRGLHGGVKEPGFLDSLEKGCKCASGHIGEVPTAPFYRELHKTLTSHFDGKSTLVTSEDCGVTRKIRLGCVVPIFRENPTAEHHFQVAYLYKEMADKPELRTKDAKLCEKVQRGYPASIRYIIGYRETWKEKLLELQSYLQNFAKENKMPAINTSFTLENDIVKVAYDEEDPLIIEVIVYQLIEQFNQKVDKVSRKAGISEEAKLNLKVGYVAELYQMLEWLHPFPDGQGRTDLVLLSKLLVDVGANPAILDHPYFSTIATFDEWKAYLLKGMEKWRALRKEVEQSGAEYKRNS